MVCSKGRELVCLIRPLKGLLVHPKLPDETCPKRLLVEKDAGVMLKISAKGFF